jgi:hypothetical protein
MKKTISVFRSFEEAEAADKDYYRSLTPQERLSILLELNRRWPARNHAEAPARIERVYRITKRS